MKQSAASAYSFIRFQFDVVKSWKKRLQR